MDTEDKSQRHIGVLDGLRGFASLWVLLGHALQRTNFHIPLVGMPGLAVDLFMVISGYLMTYHYADPSRQVAINSPSTWSNFWIRRTFRIVPIYYVVLAATLCFEPAIGAAHHNVTLISSAPTPPGHYTDRSLVNILAHISFVFSALPHFYWRAPLPDWSLGLEMQFYLVFPFLVMAAVRFGWLKTAALVSAVSIVLLVSFPAYFHTFELPSTLPFKISVFFGGMLLAKAARDPRGAWPRIALGSCLILLPIYEWFGPTGEAIRVEILRIFTMLVCIPFLIQPRLPLMLLTAMRPLTRLLSCRIATFMADTSYCVYLIHTSLLDLFIGNVVYRMPYSPAVRFVAAIALTIPVAYAIAWVAHLTIEKPGINLGRRLLKTRKTAAATGASGKPLGKMEAVSGGN